MTTGNEINEVQADTPVNEKLSHKKLFIAVPVYGSVDPHFFCSWSKLLANWNINVTLYPHFGDSLVNRARNHCSRIFLESDCTHMLFIDSDLVFSLEQINRILEHDEELVGGAYYKKSEGEPQGVWNLIDKREQANGLLRCGYVGTGFMRISRSVFERMIDAFGDEMEYWVDPDHSVKEYDFFHVGPYRYKDGRKTRFLSEDWWFCQKWMDLGGKVWLDFGCILKHSGNAVYPLKTQEEKIFKRVPVASAAKSLDQAPDATSFPVGASGAEISTSSMAA